MWTTAGVKDALVSARGQLFFTTTTINPISKKLFLISMGAQAGSISNAA